MTDFTLKIDDGGKNLARCWAILAISALALAGLYSLLLVLGRANWLQEIIPIQELFKTTLTIHVNLSVLVWLLSCGGVLWVVSSVKKANIFDWLALLLATVGTTLMALSPFISEALPLLNNYVPILQSKPFFASLLIFGAGVLLVVINTLIRHKSATHIMPVTHNAIFYSAVFIPIAAACFYLSYDQLDVIIQTNIIGDSEYHELLFWGGGHILQFTYVQLMIISWLVLANYSSMSLNIPYLLTKFALVINFIIVLPAIYIYLITDITDFEHKDFFTQHMRYGGGIAAFIVGVFIFKGLVKSRPNPETRHLRNALKWSLLLFASGGIISFMISGVNTIIPAHYHGSIVGVTLAMMGLMLYIMPKIGFGEVKGRLANIQPMLYGGGQLLHIIGLAWSGGYGALRKTPGAMESIEGQAAMGLMGLGGLISIIGGLFFVIIAFKSIFKR